LRRISIRPETIEQLITDGLLTASFVENPNEMGEDDRTLKNSHTLFKFLQEEQLFNRYGFGPKRLDLLANLSTVVGISLKRLLNADQPIEFPVEVVSIIYILCCFYYYIL
jgi:hypothetical protein